MMKASAGSKIPTKSKIRMLGNEYKKHWDLMLMFLPGFLLLIVFRYIPMAGITIAFKDFKMLDGIMASPWVGLKHFKELFSGTDFPQAFRNTLVISLLRLILGFPAPVLLAILLNEVRSLRYKKLIQTFTYLPHFFSWVVLGGIIKMIFATDGPANELLMMLGMKQPMQFFASGPLFITMLIITAVWQGLGWGSVLYMATIAGIDECLYEAASLDGAGKFKQILHITIPCLVPTMITQFILNLGGVLNAGFDQIYNLYNITVFEYSDIIDTYVLRRMQSMDYSLATAAGVLKSVICFALVILSNKVANKISDGEMGIW